MTSAGHLREVPKIKDQKKHDRDLQDQFSGKKHDRKLRDRKMQDAAVHAVATVVELE